ncbi:hypothetical protein GCM10009131_21240 [Morganella psychrotolerans]
MPFTVSEKTGSDCLSTEYDAEDSAAETGKTKGNENSKYILNFCILTDLNVVNINTFPSRINKNS